MKAQSELPGMLLTQSIVKVLPFPLAAMNQILKDEVNVAHDDEGWWQDGFRLVFNDQRVSLELPNLGRDGVHLVECITERRWAKDKRFSLCQSGSHSGHN